MSQRTRLFAASIVITGSLLGAIPASAGTTSYPATQCVNYGSTDTKDSWLRYFGDSTATTFGPDVTVACPAIQQGGNATATVTGRKYYSTDTVSCKFVVHDAANGNTHSTATINVSAIGPFTLDLTAGVPWPYSYSGGVKVIVCKIPKAPFDNSAELYSYTVTES